MSSVDFVVKRSGKFDDIITGDLTATGNVDTGGSGSEIPVPTAYPETELTTTPTDIDPNTMYAISGPAITIDMTSITVNSPSDGDRIIFFGGGVAFSIVSAFGSHDFSDIGLCIVEFRTNFGTSLGGPGNAWIPTTLVNLAPPP